jgi:hypothetical protein
LDRAFGGSAPSINCRGSQLGAYYEKQAAQGFAKAIAVREALFAIFSAPQVQAWLGRISRSLKRR